MKKIIKLFFLLFLSFLLISWNSVKNEDNKALLGTWKLLETTQGDASKGVQLKSFTDTHFSWYRADSEGLVSVGAMGRYKMSSSTSFVETVEMGTFGMQSFVGSNFKLNFVVKGDTLLITGEAEKNNFKFTESWLKLK